MVSGCVTDASSKYSGELCTIVERNLKQYCGYHGALEDRGEGLQSKQLGVYPDDRYLCGPYNSFMRKIAGKGQTCL